jgi:hypothetical protein
MATDVTVFTLEPGENLAVDPPGNRGTLDPVIAQEGRYLGFLRR